MTSAGADLVDVSGESPRPGAARVPLEEELHRILRVITGLCCFGMEVSVGTTRAQLAEAAVEAGAILATSVLTAHAGTWAVRVHNVPAATSAIRVMAAAGQAAPAGAGVRDEGRP